MTDLISALCARLEELRSQRNIYEPTWDEVSEFIMPSQGSYSTDRSTDVERRSGRRLDSTAIVANRTLAARIVSEVLAPGTRYMEYRADDSEIDNLPKVRDFLANVSSQAMAMLEQTNFFLACSEATTQWSAHGTAAILMERDPVRKHMVFNSIPIHQLFIAENKDGKIDTVFRCYKMSLRQIEQAFGFDNLSKSQQANIKMKPDEQVKIVHCVYPNPDFDPKKKAIQFAEFKTYYFSVDDRHIYTEGGYRAFPYKVTRFWKRAGETYGGSPGIDALADIRLLNALVDADLRIVQLEGYPPITAADDSVVMPIKIVPNGINYGGISADGRRLIDRLLPPGPSNGQARQVTMEQKREAIRNAFFIDPLINRENSIRTAAEVAKRAQEELTGIAPFLTRYVEELIKPVFEDVLIFLLEYDQRLGILDMPDELQQTNAVVSLTAPITKTYRGQELNNLLQFLQLLPAIAQVDQSIPQAVDWRATLDLLRDLLAVSPHILLSEEEFNQIKQAAAQQAQLAQGIGAINQVAGPLADLTKAGVITPGTLPL